MAEREDIEQEVVDILAAGMHQRFSELIDQISVATPMQVLRWVKLSETPYNELGPVEKIIYMKVAMVELEKLHPLLPAYVSAFLSNPSTL